MHSLRKGYIFRDTSFIGTISGSVGLRGFSFFHLSVLVNIFICIGPWLIFTIFLFPLALQFFFNQYRLIFEIPYIISWLILPVFLHVDYMRHISLSYLFCTQIMYNFNYTHLKVISHNMT